MRNHSATHLLHKALRDIIGPQVEQRGSLVEPERLRFDFASPRALTATEIALVDEQINRWIRGDLPLHTNIMPLQEPLMTGAMALFGENYVEEVSLVSMASSVQLSCPPHSPPPGHICFHI